MFLMSISESGSLTFLFKKKIIIISCHNLVTVVVSSLIHVHLKRKTRLDPVPTAQHCWPQLLSLWMLHVETGCTPRYMLLHVVGSC